MKTVNYSNCRNAQRFYFWLIVLYPVWVCLLVLYGHVIIVFLYSVNSAVFMYGCLHRDGEVLCKSVTLHQRKTETGTLLSTLCCVNFWSQALFDMGLFLLPWGTLVKPELTDQVLCLFKPALDILVHRYHWMGLGCQCKTNYMTHQKNQEMLQCSF